jgi:hypothetical protein
MIDKSRLAEDSVYFRNAFKSAPEVAPTIFPSSFKTAIPDKLFFSIFWNTSIVGVCEEAVTTGPDPIFNSPTYIHQKSKFKK